MDNEKFLKAFNKVHLIMTLIAWCIIICMLIYVLVVYNDLDDIIGVHFSGNGEFDIYDSKAYIFYPFVVGIGLNVIFGLFTLLMKKFKSGMKISEAGELRAKSYLRVGIDFMKICLSLFFSYWAYCVVVQNPLNMATVGAWAFLALFIDILLIIAMLITIRIKYRK